MAQTLPQTSIIIKVATTIDKPIAESSFLADFNDSFSWSGFFDTVREFVNDDDIGIALFSLRETGRDTECDMTASGLINCFG